MDRQTSGRAPSLLVFLALGLCVPPVSARADALEQQRKLEILSLKIPENLDLSRSRKGSAFQLEYEAEAADGKVPLRRMHSWKLWLRDPGGKPVRGAKVSFDGRMPQHSHPFPTLPSVKELAPGYYRVSGMKFHMPGWWVITFSVESGKLAEEFRFHLML
jgi:hypothetical protein